MEKRKILILVDWFVPGYKAGGPIQSCKNMINGLKDDFEFRVITSDRDLGDTEPYEGIEVNRWVQRNGYPPVFYSSASYLSPGNLRKLIDQVNPDIVYINSMYSVRLTIFPLILRLFNKIRARIVLAPRGMLQPGALKFKPLKKKLFIRLVNLLQLPQMIQFHATDETEKTSILRQFPKAKTIHVAENFPAFGDFERKPVIKNPGELKLVYVARISPEKGLLFLLNILNEHKFDGKISVAIGGKLEQRSLEHRNYVAECMKVSEGLPANISAEFVGPIAHEELFDWMQQFHFFVQPTHGENFGHSIFEALLAGKPVIISDNTPWRNLAEKGIGWDISLNDKERFVAAIRQALGTDQDEYNRWSDKCSNFAQTYRKTNDTRIKYLKLFNESS